MRSFVLFDESFGIFLRVDYFHGGRKRFGVESIEKFDALGRVIVDGETPTVGPIAGANGSERSQK
jgi:hypothetical protein